MITSILIILAVIALGAIAWVIIPKLPLLSTLHIEESPSERWKRLKKHIVVGRLARKFRQHAKELEKKIFTKERKQEISALIQKGYARLKELEDKYRGQTKENTVTLRLKRGRENLEEDPEAAEQQFLQVVRLDPRNLEAYEGLFQLYLRRRAFAEAGEICEFLTRLNAASAARYAFELASTLKVAGETSQAERYAKRALKDEPENPKYLDFLIEVAILGGKRGEVEQYLNRFKEINPENAKIAEFEEHLQKMPT